MKNEIPKATIGRIPMYYRFLSELPSEIETVSATFIAKHIGAGEVQVRKDLSYICGTGKPKIGYVRGELEKCLESYLDSNDGKIIIIGAGKLGRALLEYSGFSGYGLNVLAAFDKETKTTEITSSGKPILPMGELRSFCESNGVKIGIIAVPASSAQNVCDLLCELDMKAIMNFAPCRLNAPEQVTIHNEDMALSLAYLKSTIK